MLRLHGLQPQRVSVNLRTPVLCVLRFRDGIACGTSVRRTQPHGALPFLYVLGCAASRHNDINLGELAQWQCQPGGCHVTLANLLGQSFGFEPADNGSLTQ